MAFKPGQSGNPKGRPIGSRNKLAESFLAAMAQDFQAHGQDAIRKARESDPVAYLRTLATLVPRLVSYTDPQGESSELVVRWMTVMDAAQDGR